SSMFFKDAQSILLSDRSDLCRNKNIFLDGYFQDQGCLLDAAQLRIIRRHIEDNFDAQHVISDLGGRPLVGMHVRRGDYLTSKSAEKIFLSIPKSYYLKALERVPSDRNLLIFSDDNLLADEWAASLGGYAAHRLVSGFLREFFLLSLCDYHIIANSTFSWWAAIIGS